MSSKCESMNWLMPQVMTGFSEAMSKGAMPAVNAATRANLEAHGFVNRRVQAWLEIPAKAAQCRTPQDVVNAQMQFWQTAFQQYADSSRRIGEAWAPVWGAWAKAATAANGTWGNFGSQPAKAERDLITFPEPREPSSQTVRMPGERHAA